MVDYHKKNAALFQRLKKLAFITNEQELFDVVVKLARDYEDLRKSYIKTKEKNASLIDDDFLFTTGRALTNLVNNQLTLNNSKKISDLSGDTPQSKNNVVVFCATRGGLCNRLRAIASLKIICQNLNIPFYFVWTENPSCSGSLVNYLDNQISVSDYFELINNDNLIVYSDSNPMSEWIFFRQYNSISNLGSTSQFSLNYQKKSLLLLEELVRSLNLHSEINNFLNEKKLFNYLAIHIRRTDFVKYYEDKYPDKKLPSIDDYVNLIECNIQMNENFFISTDEIDVIKKLQSKFDKQMITSENFGDFNSSKMRHTSFRHSVIDLYLLSQSFKIITTPGSSFSQFSCSVDQKQKLTFD